MSNSNLGLNDLTAEPSFLERSAKHVTKFRLDEINKMKDYLNAEIKERKDIVKKISKYIIALDYADKLFITLSVSFSTLSIASHATIVGIPVGITGASLTLIFTVTTGVIKKLLNITRKKKKKHNKIMALARSKLNITETLIKSSKTELTAVENKIPDVDGLATASALTAVENKIPDITSLITKTDFDAKLKNISDRVTNNKSKDLLLDNELKKLKTLVDSTAKIKFDEVQKENSFNRRFFYYLQQSYLVYDCNMGSFQFTAGKISTGKSTGIFNYLGNSNMNAVGDSKSVLPELKNDGRMHVSLSGNHFQQNKVIIPNNNNVINIYCAYKIDPIASTRDDTFTVQNAVFGAMEITKNADTSKYNYKGYGICFDEGSTFGHTIREGNFDHTTNARNMLIFGADMSFSTHKANKANNIYVMGELFVQGINDTTLYAEKKFYRNFTDPGKKFLLSLHYNGDNSYLFVNGRQELKFKAKTDQLVKKKAIHRKFE